MGSVRGGARPPSQTAYFVALAGILVLLLMLCCYFVYFCVKRVKELSRQMDSPTQPVTPAHTRSPPSYPVQPVVRDSATAMVKLCKQLPPPTKGDTVFPTSTSPLAQQTDTGDTREIISSADAPDKAPITQPAVTQNEVTTAR